MKTIAYRSINDSYNDNWDRTRAEILSSLPIRKEGTGKKEGCLSASCFRWHSSAHQRIAWEENVIWYVQGDAPRTNPIGDVQSFSATLKKKWRSITPTSIHNLYYASRWSSNTVNLLMSRLDATARKRSLRRGKGRKKDTSTYVTVPL